MYLFPGAAITKHKLGGKLKTAKLYFLTVLETRNLKLKCRQGHVPSEDSREESFLGCCWQFSVFLSL